MLASCTSTLSLRDRQQQHTRIGLQPGGRDSMETEATAQTHPIYLLKPLPADSANHTSQMTC